MKIVSGVKTIAVEYPNGKKEVLSFDANNADNLQAWTEKAKTMQDIDFAKVEDINAVVAILSDIFITVFGKIAYKKFWRKTNKDITALAGVVSETSRLLEEAMENFKKIGK